MTRGCIIVEATTSDNTESLLPNRASYTRSLSRVDDELRSFPSHIRCMCVDQSDARHIMVSWYLFLFIGAFVTTTFQFVLFYAPTHWAYNVVVQLFFTSTFDLSYLYLSTFVCHYNLHRFLFLNKIDFLT
ncbi:hypothetical protein GW17_00007544 [Ensete ventricosum]|nr:hypothetical protein GW17_00007544 [Ensete ventricosum]